MLSSLLAVLSFSLVLLIAGIFAHAGISKLIPANRAYYASVIQAYAVAPASWTAHLVVWVGVIELCTAILAVIPHTRQLGMLAAAAIFSGYAAILLKSIYEGKRDLDCGCAGPGGNTRVGPGLVGRNLLLVAAALLAALNSFALSTTVLALGVPLLLILALIYLSVEQLFANAQKVRALRETGL